MASPAHRTKVMRPRPLPAGFDVTCTIGRVTFDALADTTPQEAAFLLIARHGADGAFSFPSESEGMITVTVETEARSD